MSTTRYVPHQYSLPSQPLCRNRMKKKNPGSAVNNAEVSRLDVDIKPPLPL
jgi:hypothetical protein